MGCRQLSGYRYNFLDENGMVEGGLVLQAESDQAACELASDLLRRSECSATRKRSLNGPGLQALPSVVGEDSIGMLPAEPGLVVPRQLGLATRLFADPVLAEGFRRPLATREGAGRQRSVTHISANRS